ncbi:MAG: hypothetical protein K2K81_08615 [Muribaculaceae bacterium]|nr:hypothetical protein [Muribaculaceae bacterium]
MNFKRYFTYIGIAVAGILSGCSDDMPDFPSIAEDNGVKIDGESVSVSASMAVPSLVSATRAFSDEADLANLHLYLVEFVDNGNPLINTFSRIYEAEDESADSGNGVMNFDVTLRATASPRILHLVALPKGETLTADYGVEATVIPGLKTSGGVEAYWRRLSFPDGYCSPSGDGAWRPLPGLREMLTGVGLIRNFAKISITDNAADFQLTGYEIVNNPKQGTVAPWNASANTFPEFVAPDGNPLEYKDLKSAYKGRVPANVDYSNKPGSSPLTIPNGVNPKYMYERPASDLNHTYLILKGIRKGQEMYYKLDIGQNDATGLFNFYPILRNFDFHITLNSVNADGYKSVAEAVEGIVFNNLSFDLELSNLLNMSDGKEIVFVNFTTAVLTSPDEQTIEFKYRYKNLATNKYDNTTGLSRIGLVEGDVIKKIVDKGTGSDNWHTVELTIHPASAETKTQSFTIVKKSGLGRTINLVLHQRWEFENLVNYKGSIHDWSLSTPDKGVVGPEASAPFTLFFDLPDNLPSAVFPMTFVIESDRQNVENLPGSGQMAVSSGETLFDNSKNIRIQYKKVVTWADYNTPVSQGGMLIDNPDGTQTHRVSCLFRTLMSMKDLYPSTTKKVTETTTMAIDNENYLVGKTEFKRTYNP